MHCYRTFAAVTLIANTLELLPQVGRKLPYAMIADWMSRHDLEPEELLFVSPEEARAIIVNLVEKDCPQMPRAA